MIGLKNRLTKPKNRRIKLKSEWQTHFLKPGFYLAATTGVGLFGWYLQHVAFTPPPPASQVYAAVFVRALATHVNLSANVYADEPWNDQLTVTVSGKIKQPGWLLVIECPAGPQPQPPGVQLNSETGPSAQSPAALVTVHQGAGTTSRPISFGCFPPPGRSAGLLGTSAPSLADVSLPALQLDQEIVGSQSAPMLYAEQNSPGGNVVQLIQVFPGAVCPSPEPAPSQSNASPGTTSPAPETTPASQPSALASLPPSATASAGAPESPGCYAGTPAAATFIPYQLPTRITTTETLHEVDTKGYQVSMSPVEPLMQDTIKEPGHTTENEIMWSSSSGSGLNPSLDATNQAAESAANHDIFVAGVCFGIAGGTAVAFFDSILDAVSGKKEEASTKDQTGDDLAGPVS